MSIQDSYFQVFNIDIGTLGIVVADLNRLYISPLNKYIDYDDRQIRFSLVLTKVKQNWKVKEEVFFEEKNNHILSVDRKTKNRIINIIVEEVDDDNLNIMNKFKSTLDGELSNCYSRLPVVEKELINIKSKIKETKIKIQKLKAYLEDFKEEDEELITMIRSKAIDKLVSKEIKTIGKNLKNGDTEYLDSILRGNMFTPYEKMDNDTLKIELSAINIIVDEVIDDIAS